MNTEQQIISEIRKNLKELEIEAYGRRKHGHRELLPNIYHFYRYFKKLYEDVYSLNQIEGQNYIPQGHIDIIYDVERTIETEINTLMKKRNVNNSLTEMLPTYLINIQESLVCVIGKFNI